jgi:uncharacterized protein involved in type VI secretion and phage assembly
MRATTFFGNFIDRFRRFGLEYWGRYYAHYRATVVNNEDDKYQGKIKVSCPFLGDREGDSRVAYPIDLDGAADGRGRFYPPEKGDKVYVVFENGDTRFPLYLGGWFAKDEIPEDFKKNPPTARGFVSKSGHAIIFDDSDDEEKVVLRWKAGKDVAHLTFDKDGGATLETKDGVFLKLHAESGQKGFELDDGETKFQSTPTKTTIETRSHKLTFESGQVKLEVQGALKMQATTFEVQAAQVSIGQGEQEPVARGTKLTNMLTELTGIVAQMKCLPPLGAIDPSVAAQLVALGARASSVLAPNSKI